MDVLPQVLLIIAGAPLALACAYLLVLTLLSGEPPTPVPSSRRLKFDILVPARDEASVLARILASLRQLNWPEDQVRILVVADNCTDTTAVIARNAGAVVVERCDPEKCGKGYALLAGFAASREAQFADAVVVVDADSEISPNFLEACAARIERGAHAVQAYYGVLAPQSCWRAQLLSIAYGAFHRARSRARERLGLSCGLRGNGWCVTHTLLQSVPYEAFSLVEDLEYGVALGVAGTRVYYADEAFANAEITSREASVRQQRMRWEVGRRQVARATGFALMRNAVRMHDRLCFDLAIDLMVPPLSRLSCEVALLLGLTGLMSLQLQEIGPALGLALFCAASLAVYVFRGWQLSGLGLRGLVALAWAPLFVAWKLALPLIQEVPHQWVRTDRERI